MLWLILFACGEEPTLPSVDDEGWRPDLLDVSGSGALEVGVARASIVPTCFESWDDIDGNDTWSSDEPTFDCGCDQLCPDDVGYPGPDEGEGDGVFQAAWLAGFQTRRPARGVRDASEGLRGEGDGLLAHAVVLKQGDVTLAVVNTDAIGWFYTDTLLLREEVAAAGLDVDHVILQANHTHISPDTMGIWGPSTTKTGLDLSHVAYVRETAVSLIAEALQRAVAVDMSIGRVDTRTYHERGSANLITDTRDPWIVYPWVNVAHFTDTATGETVTTLVNWANHPETVGGDTRITSDYVHALRRTVEEGVTWDAFSQNGVGGTTVFLNGAVGGMMTSLRGTVEDPDGGSWQPNSFEKADAVGQLVGGMALDAVRDAEPVTPTLRIQARTVKLPVQNWGFQAMFLLEVLRERALLDYDPNQDIGRDNEPSILTEIDVVDIGPLRWLTVPGELLPELFIGGYDGQYTPAGVDIVDPDNANPPVLSAAPEGPYLEELAGASQTWVLGLGNDELGYVIPEYNFVVDEVAPYIFEAEGDHYEETNSLGPDACRMLLEATEEILTWDR